MFAALLEDCTDPLLREARAGYIAGRVGMTPTEVLDQLDQERREAIVQMTGFGFKMPPIGVVRVR